MVNEGGQYDGTRRTVETMNNHQLASLSQERAKRKHQKQLELQQEQNSPFKLEKINKEGDIQDKNKTNLMDLLQECTKNIDKLEFKPSAKKQLLKESPQKQPIQTSNQKAAVCVVDLSLKEEPYEDRNSNQLRIDDQIIEDEEEEGSPMKNMPNATSQKESSPFKQIMMATGEGM